MASVNKVHILGNCGRDPEVRYLASGEAVANISIATSNRRKDKTTGEMIEDTQWHRVTFFGRLAEIAGEYVKKGDPIYIEGRIKYGTYVDKTTGVEKATCDIMASEMQLLGSRNSGGGGQQGDDQGGQQNQQRQQPQQSKQNQQRQQPQQPQQQNGYAAARGRPQPQQNQQPAQQQQRPSSGFDDTDDDIPF